MPYYVPYYFYSNENNRLKFVRNQNNKIMIKSALKYIEIFVRKEIFRFSDIIHKKRCATKM